MLTHPTILPPLRVVAGAVTVEPSWHRNLRAKRSRARVVLRLQRKTGTVNPARALAARQLLVEHHGTRGEAVLAMAGDGYNTVRRHKTHQEDWKRPRCIVKDSIYWVFKSKECCPGRPGASKCGFERKHNSIRFSQTDEGKAAAARAGNNGGGGNGGGKANGNAGEAEKIRKLQEEVRQLKQDKKEVVDVSDDDAPEGDDMETDVKSKAKLEADLAGWESDVKYAEGMVKTYPKAPKYVEMLEKAKSHAAEARKQLHELKDPVDQLQYKSNRLRRLADLEKKWLVSLREADDEERAAKEKADALREKIHDGREEAEQIRVEQRELILQGAQPVPPPADLGGAVEAMRLDFTEMFGDSSLPQSASSRKGEVEAGFVTMANLLTMLASISAEYKAAKAATQAPPIAAPLPAPTAPGNETAAAGVGGGTGSGAATPSTASATMGPATAGAEPGPRDANKSQEERSANRERTPPPRQVSQSSRGL